jgi:hypothetical protein
VDIAGYREAGGVADNNFMAHNDSTSTEPPIGVRLDRIPLPPATLRVRLKTSPALRRAVPTRLVVRRAKRSAERLWETSPSAREWARVRMEAIVGGTSRAGELDELAREFLIDDEVRRGLFWQPWRYGPAPAESQRRLAEALAAETGTLISWAHLGFYYKAGRGVVELGHDIYRVTGPWLLETPSNDFWGRRNARWRNVFSSRHDLFVCAPRSYPVLRSLLEAGETVLIAFDVPGPRETRFLGKPVMLADGTARLAAESGARILPTRARLVGGRVVQEYGPPLEASELGSAEEIHNALAAVHEQWILEAPATLEDPRRAGFWEDGATALGWTLPSSRARVA